MSQERITMPSIRGPSPDATLPGPAPRARVVGRNSCRRCRRSKICCRRTEPGPCTNYQQRGFECEQAQEDGRTNRAASDLLAEKIAYFEGICRDYLFLFQILCSDDPMDADIRGTVAEKALAECPTSIVPFLRREGYSEVRVRCRPVFVPAVSADDASTLSDRRSMEMAFRRASSKHVDQLEAVLECVAVGICPHSQRDTLLAASRTGHRLQEAINGVIAYLKVSLPWMLKPQDLATAHYHKVLEEPSLSAFRTLRAETPPGATPPPTAPSPLPPAQ